MDNLAILAENVLLANKVPDKLAAVDKLAKAWQAGIRKHIKLETLVMNPGKLSKPELVPPRLLAKRKLSNKTGQAAMLHSIAHIEFNAINLAIDAIYRFTGLPEDYYEDWLNVTIEEVYHFKLLIDYLAELGYKYGDFVAHNGLWEMAIITAHDPLVRMALIPRVMEARGLDVTPSIIKKFKEKGDLKALNIISIIQRDEVQHVKKGSKWFYYLCEQRGLEPLSTFKKLVRKYAFRQVKPPFSLELRRLAGFTEEELTWLQLKL